MDKNQIKSIPITSAGNADTVGISRETVEKWMDEDLEKSGLSRDDIEVEAFIGESFMNQSVSGYRILVSYVLSRSSAPREWDTNLVGAERS